MQPPTLAENFIKHLARIKFAVGHYFVRREVTKVVDRFESFIVDDRGGNALLGPLRPHFLGPFLDFQYPRGLKGPWIKVN